MDSIKPKETRTFSLENDALDLLLFNFLKLIYYKDSEQLLLQAAGSDLERKWITAKRSCSGEMLDSIGTNSGRCQSCYHRFQLEKKQRTVGPW